MPPSFSSSFVATSTILGLLALVSLSCCAPYYSSGRIHGSHRSPPFMEPRSARDPFVRPMDGGDWLDAPARGASQMKSPYFHSRQPYFRLTPLGSTGSSSFISDDLRHGMTKEQQQQQTQPQEGASGEEVTGEDGTSAEGDLREESPTFTPFIGARALSNMDEFFKELQENIQAIQDGEKSAAAANAAPTTTRQNAEVPHKVINGLASKTRGSSGFTSSSSFGPDAGGRIKPSSSSDSSSAWAASLPASAARDAAAFSGASSTSPLMSSKKLTFVQPLTAEEAHLRRAGNYNPAWLWTTMGLGKRGRK